MIWRFPFVYPNQRIIPRDFLRLASMAEDLLAHVAQQYLFSASDVDITTPGIVLYGLGVSIQAGPVARIAAGAALLPAGAGERRWRLVYVPSALDVPIEVPDAGDRDDMIELGLEPEPDETADPDGADVSLDATSVQDRQFRRVNNDGAEEIYNDNVRTYRRPVALAQAQQDVNPALAAPTQGFVRLATVNVTSAAVAVATDRRSFWLTGATTVDFPNGWDTGAAESGKYYRGIRAAVSRLLTAVSGVARPDGRLHTVLRPADGGPSIQLAAAVGQTPARITFGLRSVESTRYVRARAVDIGADLDVAAYRNIPDGTRLNKGTIVRASVNVRATYDGAGNFTGWTWVGQNIDSVTREVGPDAADPAGFSWVKYVVGFDANVNFGEDNTVASGRWRIDARPNFYEEAFALGPHATRAAWITPTRIGGNAVTLYLWRFGWSAGAGIEQSVGSDFSFSLDLQGPLGQEDEWTVGNMPD